MRKGLLVVISAPSGGGKGTILKELFAQDDNLGAVGFRHHAEAQARGGGRKQYYFISREEFESLIAQGKMLEHAEYVGNYYGTPKEPVEQWTSQGRDVVLEIEVQGGAQIKRLMPDCVSVFILPPSMAVLEKRLRGPGHRGRGHSAEAPGPGQGGDPPRQGLRLCGLQRPPGGRSGRPAGHPAGGEVEIY